MHSISPVLRRLARRAAGPGTPGGEGDAEEAAALWGAVLDGALEELELGALLTAASLAGETTDELQGLHRALAARQARFSPELARRALSIPVYGLVPGEAVLSVLLALYLGRFEVPVVMHGPLESPEGPSAPALLRELGVMPSATLADAARDLRARGVAFVPAQLLSPALADLLALRTRLGSANSAHLAAHALDPGGMGAVRLVSCVPGSRSERLVPLARATDGDALLLSWPARASACNLALRPRVAMLSAGAETGIFEAESPGFAAEALPRLPANPVPWMRGVLERLQPAPLPLVQLAAACVLATGAAADLTRAKAIAALQSGRLAA